MFSNEPGRTDWEGLATATRAAAAGGVTTIVDMPLNSIPPTVHLEGLRAKEEAAVGKISVDLGLWGGISSCTDCGVTPAGTRGCVTHIQRRELTQVVFACLC